MAEDEYKKIFSKNLRYFMEKNDKTQMDLMKDLGLSSSTVSNWCTGLKLPRMDKVQMLADYFGILKSDLIEEKEEINPDTYYISEETRRIAQEIHDNPTMRSLFDMSRKMTPERLEAHLDFMKKLYAQEHPED